MSNQHRQPLATKTNNDSTDGEAPDPKDKDKDTSDAPKISTHPSKNKPPTSKDKGKSKASPNSSTPKEVVPGSLERLFSIDISRALNAQAPTRYDPYYRFPGQPNKSPVYAPYSSDVLEEMARVGVIDYSLALSEDSRCWRLNELMRDDELMKKFMENPKGWTVELGPREIEYNVEDIIAARMGMEPTYSSSSRDDFTPNPCDTPHPSTPYCARERQHLKATISWAGMYDRLEDREAALAKARSDRSQSATPSLFSSSSTANYGEMSGTSFIPCGLSEKGKKEQVVWKTAYEDAISNEELGRQLEEQTKNKHATWDDTDSISDSDEDEYGSSKSLFRPIPQSSIKDKEELGMRNSVFRAWNDIDSDDEDQVDEDGEEDSDDDISECDIELDPYSPSTSSRCGGDDLTATQSSIVSSQVSPETDKELGREREKKQEQKQEIEREREREKEQGKGKEKEQEQEKVIPAPHVRLNAKNFLHLFCRPPLPPTPIIGSDDQSKKKVED